MVVADFEPDLRRTEDLLGGTGEREASIRYLTKQVALILHFA